MNKTIDLTNFANYLAMEKKTDHIKYLEVKNEKARFFTITSIKKTHPEIEVIENNFIAFKIFLNPNNPKDLLCHTLFLVEYEANFHVFLPDLNRTLIKVDSVNSINFRTSTAVVSFYGFTFQVATKISDLGVEKFAESDYKTPLVEGDDVYIDFIEPYKIIPVKLSDVPKGVYNAKLNGKITEQYKSTLAALTSDKGEIYNNVQCNSMLNKILSDNSSHIIQIGDTLENKIKVAKVDKHKEKTGKYEIKSTTKVEVWEIL